MAVSNRDMDGLLADLLKEPVAEVAPPPKATPVRSAPRRAPARRASYDEIAGRGADIAGLLVWIGLWVADGWFTALFVSHVFRTTMWIGAAAHIAVSLIQHHLWRRNFRDHWMIIIPIAIINITTSIVGLWQWMASRTSGRPFPIFDILTVTAPQSVVLFWAAVVIGAGIAIVPERKAAKHGAELLQQRG